MTEKRAKTREGLTEPARDKRPVYPYTCQVSVASRECKAMRVEENMSESQEQQELARICESAMKWYMAEQAAQDAEDRSFHAMRFLDNAKASGSPSLIHDCDREALAARVAMLTAHEAACKAKDELMLAASGRYTRTLLECAERP